MSNDNSSEERRKKTLELIDRITPENSHDLIDFCEYTKLKQENEDYKLMLNALLSGWEVWLGDNKWIWDDISEFDVQFEVPSTQSSIPEINDELREIFKKL